jgi:hypothetical protein
MSTFDRDRDHPLTLRWTTDPDVFSPLGLPPLRSKVATLARTRILTEAIVRRRADPDSRISYSRRIQHYTNQVTRYRPQTYSYRAIVPAINSLAASGVVGHMKASPGDRGWQSQIWATDDLTGLLIPVAHQLLELIVLRDGDDKVAVDYEDTPETRRMRRGLCGIHEIIDSSILGLGSKPIRDGDPLKQAIRGLPVPIRDGKKLNLDVIKLGAATHELCRIFRRTFAFNGRLYEAWWQNIPREYRAHVTIDGETTHEEDYPHLHPTLLYAAAGQTMDGDPYVIDGWSRKVVKVAFNILVNATDPTAAVQAIVWEARKRERRARREGAAPPAIVREILGPEPYPQARDLVTDIQRKHSAIAHRFASGAGLALMRRDSDMAEAVLLRLGARGIVALPVHDSFIVAEKHKSALQEVMDDELRKSTGDLW